MSRDGSRISRRLLLLLMACVSAAAAALLYQSGPATQQTAQALLVLLSLLSVALFAIEQARRPSVPVAELQRLARRLAEGRFDLAPEAGAGGELEELANSFRAMAERLERSFEKLETLVDAERAVLSAVEVPELAEQVVARIRELYPCDAAAVAVVDPEDPASLLLVVSPGAGLESRRLGLPGFDAAERRALEAGPDGFTLDAAGGLPRYLAPLAELGVARVALLPLQVRDELAGVLAAGHRLAEDRDPEALPYARALARQTGAALGHIRTSDENLTLAYYDRLTGLPNRVLFRERLEQALVRARRLGHRVALLILDLDAFKRVNDTFGHDQGDRLLARVGERFASGLRSGSLARLGGDEFAVVLPDLRSFEQAAHAARSCLEKLSQPFELSRQEIFVRASVGIAVYPDDAGEADALVRNADAAMYHAKERGRNGLCFYAASMNEAAMQRLALESDLRHAVERDELRLYFQPIVDLERMEILGLEALLRWQHPQLGMIAPDVFVPIAEETGLIVSIGEWALRGACLCNRAWREEGMDRLRVAVNVSSRQLADEGLAGTLRQILAETGMPAHNLGLELTESMAMSADEATLRALHGLRSLGARLSIDDFGTGYSSLAYLKHFPVDSLKIDRSFVRDLTRNPDDAAIVQAIVAMAHGLGLFAVAEGVERREQLEFLAGHGCDAAQGTYFSEPVPADGVPKLLRDWEREER